jgi:hypothetical protein
MFPFFEEKRKHRMPRHESISRIVGADLSLPFVKSALYEVICLKAYS